MLSLKDNTLTSKLDQSKDRSYLLEMMGHHHKQAMYHIDEFFDHQAKFRQCKQEIEELSYENQ